MIKVKNNPNTISFLDFETGDIISIPRPIVVYNVINKGKIYAFGKSVDGNIIVVIYSDENGNPIPSIHYYKFVSPIVYNKVLKGEDVNGFVELALEGAYPSYVEPIFPYFL